MRCLNLFPPEALDVETFHICFYFLCFSYSCSYLARTFLVVGIDKLLKLVNVKSRDLLIMFGGQGCSGCSRGIHHRGHRSSVFCVPTTCPMVLSDIPWLEHGAYPQDFYGITKNFRAYLQN